MSTRDELTVSCGVCGEMLSTLERICRACGAANETESAEELAAFALPSGAALRDGAYTVQSVLGQGGFGITYACRDEKNRRDVAIKEYFPWGCVRRNGQVEPAGDVTPEEFAVGREKFGDEAQMLTKFLAPNNSGIVDVYEVWEENNTSYMVMELLRGRTLAKVLEERGGFLTTSETSTYLEAVGKALAAVHGLNVLHRDIKPENVMVCDAPPGVTPRVVLMDFGSARVIEASRFGTGHRKELTRLVTPGYAPLEQYGSEQSFGPYTDIYALGALGYHLLTGQVPVQATDRAAGVEFVAPHKIIDAIDPNLSGAIMWAMQMKINLRPQSVDDFIAVLRSPNGFDASAYFQTETAPVSPNVMPSRESLPSAISAVSDGWFVVSIPMSLWSSSGVDWPQRCACCGEKAETLLDGTFPMNEVPYCFDCQQHMKLALGWAVSDTLGSEIKGFDGCLASLLAIVSAFFGVGSMVLTGGNPNDVSWTATAWGVMLMSLGHVLWQSRKNMRLQQEKRARQEGKISPNCATLGPAVEHRGQHYGSMVFAFKSRSYARDFRNVNVQQAFANAQREAARGPLAARQNVPPPPFMDVEPDTPTLSANNPLQAPFPLADAANALPTDDSTAGYHAASIARDSTAAKPAQPRAKVEN
jgi:serine/threonine protein kinase